MLLKEVLEFLFGEMMSIIFMKVDLSLLLSWEKSLSCSVLILSSITTALGDDFLLYQALIFSLFF